MNSHLVFCVRLGKEHFSRNLQEAWGELKWDVLSCLSLNKKNFTFLTSVAQAQVAGYCFVVAQLFVHLIFALLFFFFSV